MYLSALCTSRYWDYRKPFINGGVAKTLLRSNKTIILAMKLTAILLLTACLQVSAIGYTQSITLNMQNAPLEEVVKEIKRQTKFNFFYERHLFQNAKPVTVSVSNKSLDETLELCFSGQQFEYKIVKNTVFVKRREAESKEHVEVPRIGNGVINGKVITKEGEPLVSANVMNKRTGKGTTTDAKGIFTLNDVDLNDILIISYTGFSARSIKVSEFISLTLVMEPAINSLDKVQVQAYGTTTKRFATGNIATVTSTEIQKQPVINVLQVLQGQVPGAVIANTSGYASGNVKVEIRGRNTINGTMSSDPLYIIDGVPLTILDISNTSNYGNGMPGVTQSGFSGPAGSQSPFFGINPSDIESVEVLKDADATAIYGSRAANGVILITTKKGKPGKSKLEVNFYQGMSKLTRKYSLLNTQQYIEMRKEALANDGLPLDVSNAPDIVKWDSTQYTDWQDYVWGSIGKTSHADVNLYGGSQQTNFRLGSGYHYQRDITAISGGNKRGSLSFNINHKSQNQRLAMSFGCNYSYSKSDLIDQPGVNLIIPNAPPVFDDFGNLNYSGWQPLDQNFPFVQLLQPYKSETHFLNSSLSLKYEILKGLSLKADFGYNNSINNQSLTQPLSSQNPRFNRVASLNKGYSFFRNIIFEPQIEYKRFVGKGIVNVLVGGSIQKNITTGVNQLGVGYNSDALLGSISNAQTKVTGEFNGQYRYNAGFTRVNYTLLNRYIVNANFRRDGSSKFGPGRQFGNFGSVGAAWLFGEERMIKNSLSFLSFGKLRGSYGITGGDQIADYSYLTQWTFSQYLYNGSAPLTPTKHTDSLLQWQVNKKLELGLVLGFLADRINLEVSWYRNRCDNQLVSFPTPATSGFTFVISNSPANVENSGWEFVLNSKIFNGTSFNWDSKFNISFNRNKLLSYPNISQSPYAGSLVVGQSLNVQKVLRYTGVDPQTGLYTFQDRDENDQTNVDVTGKTADDRYLVNTSPKFDGGFLNTFSYKNWELSVLFYFKKQVGRNAYSVLDVPGNITNQPVEVFNNTWRKPGDISTFAKFTTNPADISYQNFYRYSDGTLTDASFIRLRNLSFSYTLPNSLIKRMGMGVCRVFAQGENLFVITNYKGTDPEIQNFSRLPLAKIMTVGISLNF